MGTYADEFISKGPNGGEGGGGKSLVFGARRKNVSGCKWNEENNIIKMSYVIKKI